MDQSVIEKSDQDNKKPRQRPGAARQISGVTLATAHVYRLSLSVSLESNRYTNHCSGERQKMLIQNEWVTMYSPTPPITRVYGNAMITIFPYDSRTSGAMAEVSRNRNAA